MHVIHARNVNDAFIKGLTLLKNYGTEQDSRAGKVRVMSTPVTTAYQNPTERVLFHSKRDANPFFHLMEALWMLAGRHDATWLDQFVKDFSSRFAEDDGIQHGAYGYRWRHHFDLEGGGSEDWLPDQLETVIRLLKKNPDDRRIVLTMWDPVADLGQDKRDIPCNTQLYFRVRQTHYERGMSQEAHVGPALDMTVCCRSNDAIWGAYGANAVHFSILQEYVAARIGALVGVYYQMSNNFHAYSDVLDKIELDADPLASSYNGADHGPVTTQLVAYPNAFDHDLECFFGREWSDPAPYSNPFFTYVAVPMRFAYELWRCGAKAEALSRVMAMPPRGDWSWAAQLWMTRRMNIKMRAAL
jgi:thymidylate synthase